MSNNVILIDFLRDLAQSIEENKLHNIEIEHIHRFYMEYHFKKEVMTDTETDNNTEGFKFDDLLRFLSLGWYIYTVMLKDEIKSRDEVDTDDEVD